MIERRQGDIRWLQFEQFLPYPELVHGVFLRAGGVSLPPLDGLNLSYSVDDQAEHVITNRRLVMEALGLETLISANQCHGVAIARVDKEEPTTPCDALATNRAGVGLLICHADCQAAIFYDPVTKSLANVHSGWRGNAQNIYQETVRSMEKTFGTRPQDLLVGISPSLGPAHSEFVNWQQELPASFVPFRQDNDHFDLWALGRQQLIDCGILPSHIEVAGICTFDHPSDYFSYRRDSITGRNGTIAALKA